MQPESWRDLMEPVRLAARSLVHEGKLEVLQKGEVVGSDEVYVGPIRLRLPECKAKPPEDLDSFRCTRASSRDS